MCCESRMSRARARLSPAALHTTNMGMEGETSPAIGPTAW